MLSTVNFKLPKDIKITSLNEMISDKKQIKFNYLLKRSLQSSLKVITLNTFKVP